MPASASWQPSQPAPIQACLPVTIRRVGGGSSSMYNAEMAGEQMGSVCLAEVVPGVAEGVVVERTVRGGVGLHGRRGRLETRTGPRRSGLRGGRERLPHDRRAGGGRSRRAGGRVPRGAGRRVARKPVGRRIRHGAELHSVYGQGIARAGGGPDDRGFPIAGREGPLRLDARPWRTTTEGQALTVECDCCCPFPPPVFVCCCSGVRLGRASRRCKSPTIRPAVGSSAPSACNQRIHTTWEKFVPDNEVNSFHCGCFDCDHLNPDPHRIGTIHRNIIRSWCSAPATTAALPRPPGRPAKAPGLQGSARDGKIRINNAAAQLDNVADCAGGLLATQALARHGRAV